MITIAPAPIRFEEAVTLDGLDRLDLIDIDALGQAVQHYFDDLAVAVTRADARLPRPIGQSNYGGCWLLFSYRTFHPPTGSDVDPVVAGVTVSRVGSDLFRIAGDIAGEGSGDILFEVAARERMGSLAVEGACGDVAAELARQWDVVVRALHDGQRVA